MLEKKIVFVLLLAPTLLQAESAHKIKVVAEVPLVAQVDSPPSVVGLAPGETRLVTIRVACNQAWLLEVQTDNPQVRVEGRFAGHAGGMAAPGHTFTVALSCAAGAAGPQVAQLTTRLASGPLAAGLQR